MHVAKILALVVLCVAAEGQESLRFARGFGDHMVLQRGQPIAVRGHGVAAGAVQVRLGDVKRQVKVAADGTWQVSFPARPANKRPLELVAVAGDERVVLRDVLIGDVFLCAGQSNMRFPLRSSVGGKQAIAKADLPLVRLFDMHGSIYPSRKKYALAKLRAVTPQNYYTTRGWQVCAPGTVAGFSAVAFHFARALHERTDAPIGLIHNAVGGVPIETYLPREAMAADEKLRPLQRDWFDNPDYPQWCRQRGAFNLSAWLAKRAGPVPHHPFAPGFLFDAGVRPFVGMPLRAVLWYQGESNATTDGALGAPVPLATNAHKLRTLIRSWRAAWGTKLPFLLVQLPGLAREWAPFREAQRRVAHELEGVELAVTLDLGHPTDVHPKRKREVGERLARLLAGERSPDYVRQECGGGAILLHFDQPKRLRTTDGKAPREFAVAGADRVFYPARASILRAGILVRSQVVRDPVAIRYAWANDPDVNLVAKNGLPVVPFRTDDWPLKPKVRVACIGDSITAGHGLKNPYRQSYPAVLRAMLGPDYAVRGFGSSGRGVVKRSMRGKTKRAFLFQRAHRDALAWRPHIVVSNLGINDLMDWRRGADGQKASHAEFVADYRELIHAYKKLPTQPAIFLWGPLAPLFDGHRFHGDTRITQIHAAIAAVAKAERLRTIDLHTPLRTAEDHFPDRIHPDLTGSREIALWVAAALRKTR